MLFFFILFLHSITAEQCMDGDIKNIETISLLHIPYENMDNIDTEIFRNSVLNTGFLKVEMPPKAKELSESVDNILKQWFADIEYGQNLNPKKQWMSPYWFPQKNTVFGYLQHFKDPTPTQVQHFHIPWFPKNFFDHDLNPFKPFDDA
eukprot:901350_1